MLLSSSARHWKAHSILHQHYISKVFQQQACVLKIRLSLGISSSKVPKKCFFWGEWLLLAWSTESSVLSPTPPSIQSHSLCLGLLLSFQPDFRILDSGIWPQGCVIITPEPPIPLQNGAALLHSCRSANSMSTPGSLCLHMFKLALPEGRYIPSGLLDFLA